MLGFSLGFLNFIKGSPYSAGGISNEIKIIYPNIKIFIIRSQSQLIKMIKDGQISRETISKDMIVILSDKTTLETAINRYKIPYCTFKFAETTKRINTDPNIGKGAYL